MKNKTGIPYEILAPLDSDEVIIFKEKILKPFDSNVLAFINEVSNLILKDPSFRRYPELVAMAFWMRKSNISKLKTDFETEKGDRLWSARGVVFHIAPSNVDTIFIYSWFLSMLVGNINIVRISSRLNEPVRVLIDLINKIANKEEYSEIKNRFLIIQYERNDEITGHFSSACDVRVIWGGDETIKRIRQIPLDPTATELIFADKFSFSLINADIFNSSDSKSELINNFYNDAYWFGQNACSSPRLVVWLGKADAIDKARKEFWSLLSVSVKKKLENAPAVAVTKLVSECALAINSRGDVRMEESDTSLINRIFINDPDDIDREGHCGGGLFYEFKIEKLEELLKIIKPKDQTISVFGVSEEALRKLMENYRPPGVNRIVPVGRSLNFSSIWDGYNLLREFCREIDIAV
ncbi:MAG: acyl-CoA reductase [Candidatus Zixiibacteriota bacterium]|nr:MAG: acyl-CoA reductase [candidate division Zixibacteria bacterium]